MIQNSVNQLLGIAGLAGGYLSKARADILRPQLEAAADKKSAEIDAATTKEELAQVGEPKASVRGALTTPIQTLGEVKVQESKLKEQYRDKMNSLPDAAKKMAMEHAAQAVQAQQELANNSFVSKKVWTPGEIRRDNEAKKTAQEKFEEERAKQKGFAERDLGI